MGSIAEINGRPRLTTAERKALEEALSEPGSKVQITQGSWRFARATTARLAHYAIDADLRTCEVTLENGSVISVRAPKNA